MLSHQKQGLKIIFWGWTPKIWKEVEGTGGVFMNYQMPDLLPHTKSLLPNLKSYV